MATSGLHAQASVLAFLGGAGTVTGSKFLVDTPRSRFLVECGLFQGLRDLRRRNWASFPVDPAGIEAVLLSHAHLDHTGYLPALAARGFHGSVLATHRTLELARVVLLDSAHLLAEDAEYFNRHGLSKHSPAEPLYTAADVERVLRNTQGVAFDAPAKVTSDVTATFRRSGHVLGSSSVQLHVDGGVAVLFSGDLGRRQHPLLLPPEPPPEADVVVVESTYGDRTHPPQEEDERLAAVIRRTVGRGGSVVIPAFAVDRTEVVLLALRRLRLADLVPEVPVYVDSPMALTTLGIYRRAAADGDTDVKPNVGGDGDPFDPGDLHELRTVEQSMSVNAPKRPSIIVSASGMATGGRVIHHLAQLLPDPRNSVLLVGFQAAGTRGRSLADGAREVKMLGRYVPVRADVETFPGFSVHADAWEIIAWLAQSPRPPSACYVVHGEPHASAAMAERIRTELGWTAVVPRDGERVRLD